MDLDPDLWRGDAAVIVSLLACLLSSAHAGVLSTYGGGAVGSAGNAGATVRSPLAAWHNPAAMRSPRIEESAEWVYGQHRFRHNKKTLPVTPDANGMLLGAVVGGYWLRLPEVNVGLATYLPLAGPYSWLEEPEGWRKTLPSPEVPRYADELNRMEVALAANAWLTPWLSVGIGVDASADVETITIAELDDIDKPETAKKAQEVTIRPTFHPYAGLLVTAGEADGQQLRLGLIGRTARSMHDYGESGVKILLLNAVYAHNYRRHQAPRSVTMGASIDGIGPLEIRAESTWAEWSEMTGPYDDDLGEAWRDTMDLRLGVEAKWSQFSLQAGHRIEPGPLRQVPVGTAYLDGAARTWTAGLKRQVAETRQRQVHLILGVQRTHMGGEVVPDPSGTLRRFSGTLTAGRVGVEIGHKGQPKGAFWSK